MIIVQSAGAFAVWLVFGFLLRKRSNQIRRTLVSMPRNRKTILGPILLLASIGLLFGAFVVVDKLDWMTREGLTPMGWILVVASGLGFVFMQVMAAAMMVTLAYPGETTGPSPSSIQSKEEIRK